MLTLRWVEHGTAEYEALVELRRMILRAPLGLDFSQEELEQEADQFQLGAWVEERAVGTLVLNPLNTDDVQMRQVAVDASCQGQGIGRALVLEAERHAQERGFQTILAHARLTAVPFYESLGYDVDPVEYLEVGIPHQTVQKSLASPGVRP